ncbi:peroxisomal membrane protein 11A-like [Montipora foliosa]|uniref:peroxisomal membrane protein 11A-like n=1 Tax=Montipora foliosa TaxID=591990 RepID=UPI0035F1FF38
MDVITAVVKYNQQTLGRDKLCRIIQYGSRLSSYLLAQAGASADLVNRLKTLDKQTSTSRKIFRLGRSLDMILGAIRAREIRHDSVLKILIICRRITFAFYYIIDHITWAVRLGLYKSNLKEWSKLEAKLWLIALGFGLLRNLYDILNLVLVPAKKNDGEERSIQSNSVTTRLASRPEILLDTVKNSADFLLPFNVMGMIELNVGLAGLLGLISSIAGAVPVWNPNMKLKPS